MNTLTIEFSSDWDLGATKAVKIIKPTNSVWSMDTGDEDLIDENELFNDNIEVKINGKRDSSLPGPSSGPSAPAG